MPTLTYMCMLVALASGCNSVQWTRISSPPSHSLLNVGVWRSGGNSTLSTLKAQTKPQSWRSRFNRNSRKISPVRYSSRAQEYQLLRALYRGTPQSPLTQQISSIRELARHADIVKANQSHPGDILVFGPPDKDGPTIGIVVSVNRAGTLTAMAIHLGRVRTIKVNPRLRSSRRHRGHVINSFVRHVRPGDPAQKRYLAGDALTRIYRLRNTL